MGVLSLSYARHTCCIREITYPPLGLLVFWLHILLGVCSLCTSGILGSWLLEYIYVLLSLDPFIFGMPGILSHILGPSMDPGVRLGGITTPYRAHIFGSGHIPPSTPFVEDVECLLSVFTLVVTLTGVVVDV